MKFRAIVLTAAAAVALAACTGAGAMTAPSQAPVSTAPSMSPEMSMAPESPSMAPSASAGGEVVTDSAAADLRTQLNLKLGEHLIFAAKATGAALGGRTDEFGAAGEALNTNGTDLGAAIGSIYGDEAKDEFNRIWSAHNGFFVDYTKGVAAKDKAMQDKAVENLTTVYVPEFAKFLSGATDVPEDALAALITEHVLTTKAIVDAQASEDFKAAAAADKSAGEHMAMLGDPLAKAIVTKMADKFQ